MKMMTLPSIVQLEEEQLKQLTTEVKETIASDVFFRPKPTRKKLTAADLWKCRKMCKTANTIIR